MHDSDIFQWMKPDAGAFRLTGSGKIFRQVARSKVEKVFGAD
jgi:hypothetical protein